MRDDIIKLMNRLQALKNNVDNGSREKKINEMMDILKKSREESKKTLSIMEKNIKETEIEELNNPAIRSIKSCIPYLEIKYQKKVAMFIKIIEFQTLVEKYSKITTEYRNKNENWQKEMILAVKPHLNNEGNENVENMLKFIEMKKMAKLMQTMSDYKKEIDK